MWMCVRSGKSECPDGWQSATRFPRLGGIKDNNCLTPKPEAKRVREQGQVKSHPSFPQTSAAGRGRADVSWCVCVCLMA